MSLSEVAATLLALAILIVSWPVKRRDFARKGWDPGFLDLKVWPARIYFFLKGFDVVKTAYDTAKDEPYWLQTLIEDVLVLPPKFLSELRMLPGSKLGASDALVASVLGQFSGIDVILKDRQAYDVTRLQLTKTLPNLLPQLAPFAEQILSTAFEACSSSEFTEVNIQDVVSQLVLRTTLFAFVGPVLAEDPELQEVVTSHPNLVRDVAVCLLFVPSFMRRWIYSILPPSISMRRLHQRARRILFRSGCIQESSSFKPLLQHLVETPGIVDEEDLTAKFLVFCGAALHTVNLSTVHAVIDLCAQRQQVALLRAESAQQLGSQTSLWHADAINRLKNLDVFLKESQRFNSPNYLSFDRLSLADIALSSGAVIPKGTYICMAAGSMAMDPEFYSSPNTFDPARFLTNPTQSRSGQDFVSTESGNIHWGSGRFSCPGRWYASATMKAFIALLVTKYDVKFPDGQTERMPNVYMDILVEPNPKQKVLVRRRV